MNANNMNVLQSPLIYIYLAKELTVATRVIQSSSNGLW